MTTIKSIEEKARRYDKALERANKLKETCDSNAVVGWMEYIFPELKESGDIRKRIIDALHGDVLEMGEIKKAIAWLEKQGNLMKALQISNAKIGELIEKNYYLKEQLEKQGKNNMGISEATKQKLEDNLNNALEKETPKSWNKFLDEQGEQKPIISDDALREGIAHFGITQYQIDNWLKKYVDIKKQGEQVLANSANTCKDEPNTVVIIPKFRVGDVISPNVEDGKGDYTIIGFNETLADYLVDGGNIPSCSIGIEFIDANFHIKEHKHVEHTRNEILSELVAEKWHYLINDCKLGSVVNVKLPFNWFDWLCRWFYASGEQSVEQKPADKVEPRQEELTEFEKAVKQVMEEAIECGDTHNLKADADMLLRLVQKSSWSEEDEEQLDRALYMMEQLNMTKSWDDVYNWLKSFKDRVQPKQEWSEEDEYMKALQIAIGIVGELTPTASLLKEIREQLKKLREE